MSGTRARSASGSGGEALERSMKRGGCCDAGRSSRECLSWQAARAVGLRAQARSQDEVSWGWWTVRSGSIVALEKDLREPLARGSGRCGSRRKITALAEVGLP